MVTRGKKQVRWLFSEQSAGKKKRTQSVARAGFTLVELLIVISIIGVLARFLFVNYAEVRARGRDSKRKSEIASLKSALRLYYNDFQAYPADDGAGHIMGCGADGDLQCDWGEPFATTNTVYMPELPVDPINVSPYVYLYDATGNGDSFTITIQLEGLSDESAATSQTSCGVDEEDVQEGVYMVCVQ